MLEAPSNSFLLCQPWCCINKQVKMAGIKINVGKVLTVYCYHFLLRVKRTQLI